MRFRIGVRSLSLLLLAGLLGACAAPSPQVSSRDSSGFFPEGLRYLDSAFQAAVDVGEIPGAVVLVSRRGKIAYFEAFGYRDREAGAPMTRDAIFRIASMTKPITTTAVMMLVEEGRIALSDPLSKHLPEFAGLQVAVERPDGAGKTSVALERAEREPTILDLLRHTSGFVYDFTQPPSSLKARYREANITRLEQDNAQFAARLAKLPLASQPGSTWEYSVSTDVLGRVVEVAAGMPLGEFFERRIFAPLGMRDTGFQVTDPVKQQRIAQPQADPRTGKRAPITDRTQKYWESGGGALVSTAGDYARFCQMMLNGGELDGTRLLSRESVRSMTSNQLPAKTRVVYLGRPGVDTRADSGMGFGLGFAVRVADGKQPLAGSVGDYGWPGIFGTYFWVDPRRDLYAVVMMQVPAAAAPLRRKYEALSRELVYNALSD